MWGKKKRAGQKEQFIPLQHRNNDGFLIPVVDEADFLEGSSSYGLEL